MVTSTAEPLAERINQAEQERYALARQGVALLAQAFATDAPDGQSGRAGDLPNPRDFVGASATTALTAVSGEIVFHQGHFLLPRILSGVNVPPAIVGLARGVLFAAAAAGLEALANGLTGANLPPQYGIYLPVALLLIRTVEGILDQAKQPPAPTVPLLHS